MKVIDIINIIEKPLEYLSDAGVNTSDVRHVKMYRQYLRLISEGHKKTNIVYHLAYEFKIGERTVYNVIDRLEREIVSN
jgi:hypothetical protein